MDNIQPFGDLHLAVTGGGAIKHKQYLEQLFPKCKIEILNEFECNVMGMELARQAKLPFLIHKFTAEETKKVEVSSGEDEIGGCELPMLFVSLGSGANYSKYNLTENGLERVKADDPKDSEDGGCFLGGTSLGAGYLVGLCKLTTGIDNPAKIMK